jgi:hypothetical protein
MTSNTTPYINTSTSNTNTNTNTNTSTNNTAGIAAISSFAQSVFTKENIEHIGRAAKEQAVELKKEAQYGDNSLRVLAFIGGVALVIVAGYEIFGELLRFNIIGAVIEIYTLLIGVLVIILEGKNTFLSVGAVEKIHKYALFLKFLWGRGCLYFICGTLQLYLSNLLNILCGAYMCFVGVLFIFIGQRTAYKLRGLRKSLFTEAALHKKFAESDLDGDGGLNLQQFQNLILSLGLDLTRRETEAAFNHIHKSQSEKLCFEEFHQWWTDTDADENIDENAFVFV